MWLFDLLRPKEEKIEEKAQKELEKAKKLRMNHMNDEAFNAYMNAADLFKKISDPEVKNCYREAVKLIDFKEPIYKKLLEIDLDNGDFEGAAKISEKLADIYIEDCDKEKAIGCLRNIYRWSHLDSTIKKAKMKLAYLYCEKEDYTEALFYFLDVGRGQISPFVSNEALLNAGIVSLIMDDRVQAERVLFETVQDTYDYSFLGALIKADSSEGLTSVVSPQSHRLNNNQVSLLLKIKRNLQETEDSLC